MNLNIKEQNQICYYPIKSINKHVMLQVIHIIVDYYLQHLVIIILSLLYFSNKQLIQGYSLFYLRIMI